MTLQASRPLNKGAPNLMNSHVAQSVPSCVGALGNETVDADLSSGWRLPRGCRRQQARIHWPYN